MNTQNSLHIIITRDYSRKGYTHGHLTIDGARVCSTLENANALVPKGQYPLSVCVRILDHIILKDLL